MAWIDDKAYSHHKENRNKKNFEICHIFFIFDL